MEREQDRSALFTVCTENATGEPGLKCRLLGPGVNPCWNCKGCCWCCDSCRVQRRTERVLLNSTWNVSFCAFLFCYLWGLIQEQLGKSGNWQVSEKKCKCSSVVFVIFVLQGSKKVVKLSASESWGCDLQLLAWMVWWVENSPQ